MVAESLKETDKTVTLAFTGRAGLAYLERKLGPRETLLLEALPALDGPDGGKNGLALRFDGGPAVLRRMGTVFADPAMLEGLRSAAAGENIPLQAAYRREDALAETAASFGSAVAAVALPTRNMGMSELAREEELDRVSRLVSAFIARAD